MQKRAFQKHLILGLFPDRKFPWLKATNNPNIPINQLVHKKRLLNLNDESMSVAWIKSLFRLKCKLLRLPRKRYIHINLLRFILKNGGIKWLLLVQFSNNLRYENVNWHYILIILYKHKAIWCLVQIANFKRGDFLLSLGIWKEKRNDRKCLCEQSVAYTC